MPPAQPAAPVPPQYPGAPPQPAPPGRSNVVPLIIGLVVLLLVGAIGAGAWWLLSNPTMSEADYKEEAGAIVEELVALTTELSESEEPSDIEGAREMLAGWADATGDLRDRAEALNPPEDFRGTQDDLIEVVTVYDDFFRALSDLVENADSLEEVEAGSEEVLSEEQGAKFFSAGTQLFSIAQDLDMDLEDVFGPMGIEGLDGSSDGESFDATQSSAEEESCFANERTVEGAAQTYLADQVDASLTNLEGEEWQYYLVPDYISEVPYCPSGGYYTFDSVSGELLCDVHGHYTD
jgi:hypothetical protein